MSVMGSLQALSLLAKVAEGGEQVFDDKEDEREAPSGADALAQIFDETEHKADSTSPDNEAKKKPEPGEDTPSWGNEVPIDVDDGNAIHEVI